MSGIRGFSSCSVALLAFAGAALASGVAAAQTAPAHAIAAEPVAAVVAPAQAGGPARATPSTTAQASGGYGLQTPQADQAASAESGKASLWPAPGRFVGVARAGFMLQGSGQWKTDCSSNAGSCRDSSSQSGYDDGSQTMFGVDALIQTTHTLRLGLGTQLVTDPTYKLSGGESFHSGTELTAQGVVEFVFPTSARFALTLRGQVGAMLLFAGRDHSDKIKNEQDACSSSEYPTCNVFVGPYAGPTAGLGVGTDFRAGKVGLRLDLVSQFYSLKIGGIKAAAGSERVDIADTVSGRRVWLSAGLEF
jgi:hypothetical protein